MKPTEGKLSVDGNQSKEAQTKIRKVAMIDPGFRQQSETPLPRSRGFGFKLPSNPNDLRNFKLGMVALFVAAVIFIGLEYKQLHDGARDASKSLIDILKK